jgi:hypothetical protein
MAGTPIGGESELPARDQREQRPDRSGGEDEGREAQNGPDDRLVPDIAAARPQRRD